MELPAAAGIWPVYTKIVFPDWQALIPVAALRPDRKY
jgi:hypothetical protein